jgi:hypothetical protein
MLWLSIVASSTHVASTRTLVLYLWYRRAVAARAWAAWLTAVANRTAGRMEIDIDAARQMWLEG